MIISFLNEYLSICVTNRVLESPRISECHGCFGHVWAWRLDFSTFLLSDSIFLSHVRIFIHWKNYSSFFCHCNFFDKVIFGLLLDFGLRCGLFLSYALWPITGTIDTLIKGAKREGDARDGSPKKLKASSTWSSVMGA